MFLPDSNQLTDTSLVKFSCQSNNHYNYFVFLSSVSTKKVGCIIDVQTLHYQLRVFQSHQAFPCVSEWVQLGMDIGMFSRIRIIKIFQILSAFVSPLELSGQIISGGPP